MNGKRLQFVLNNERYEIVSDSEISEASELWVLHDPSRPTARWLQGDDEKFFHAAAGTMDSFYPKN